LGSSPFDFPDHYGIVVKTNQGNDYLIHAPGPGQQTTVTYAKYMSNSWRVRRTVFVNGYKTVGLTLMHIGSNYWF